MRLSCVQKDVLAERNLAGPFPAMQLFSILNKGRFQPVADTNFCRSGFLPKFYDVCHSHAFRLVTVSAFINNPAASSW
jgi:hypothetical protein